MLVMPFLLPRRLFSFAVACACLQRCLLADVSVQLSSLLANSSIHQLSSVSPNVSLNLSWSGALTETSGLVDGSNTTSREVFGHHLCETGLGAELWWPSVFQHLRGPRPAVYTYTIPVACIGTILVLAILGPHLSRLRIQDFSEEKRKTYAACGIQISGSLSEKTRRRSWQMRIVAGVPLVISVLKLYPVLVPRSWKVLFFLASCYEAIVFRTFRILLMELVASDAMHAQELFERAPPTKMWAVAPLACCCRKYMTPHQPHWLDFFAIRVLMWQFMVAIPTISFLEMTQDLPDWGDRALEKLESCSLVLAVYSLFALMAACHDVLPEGRLHSKFWMMKGLFISNTVLFRASKLVYTRDLQLGSLCYPSETLASAVAGAAIIALAVPGACLARYAFPVTDLETKHRTLSDLEISFSGTFEAEQVSMGPLGAYVKLPF